MAKSTKEETPFVKVEDRIDAALLDKRRIFISSPVNNDSANEIIKQLWYLEIQDPGKPILFVINSPGGSVSDGFAIWDQVNMITSPVTTLVTGMAASMGSVLSLCATKGRRFATPNSRVMIHQPRNMGMVQGQATDLDIYAREMLKTRKRIVDIYVDYTGKDAKTVEKAIDRDTWFSADEAKEFGLLDGIVKSFKDLPK